MFLQNMELSKGIKITLELVKLRVHIYEKFRFVKFWNSKVGKGKIDELVVFFDARFSFIFFNLRSSRYPSRMDF